MTTTVTDWNDAIKRLRLFLEDAVGPRVLEIRESGQLGTEEKTSFKDIKTHGDTLSEHLIADYLRANFPDHGIRGEEGTSEGNDREFEWIVDPVDGTTNYASGMPLFGISAGLARRGVPFAGVIHYPALHKTAWAIQDRGAFVNDERIIPRPYSGQKNDTLIGATLIASTTHFFPVLQKNYANVLTLGSFVCEALFVAEGKLKAYVHTGATPFDITAATILVRESGGVAIGIKTDDLDLSQQKIPIILARERRLPEESRNIVLTAQKSEEQK